MGPGFTLIELLVVVGFIGILAGLLLPVLGRSKEKAKIAQCLSNLHQISAAVAMYVHDNQDTLPLLYVAETNGAIHNTVFSIGGHDVDFGFPLDLPTAPIRPLFSYLRPPTEVFRCPADKGVFKAVQSHPKGVTLKPSSWSVGGCSYMYNVFAGHPTRLKMDDPIYGMAGKKISWVTDISRAILIHEPPATSFSLLYEGTDTWIFQHWHESRQTQTDWPLPELRNDSSKFISPVAFVDGHVARHDFTAVIRTDPNFPFEATKDWVWYKPAEEQTH
jgi:prepilin-type processing-associated H-X9-DG protein